MRKDYSRWDDKKLMQRMQQGDDQAFNALYQRYGAKLYAYFWRMLWQDKELAEDFTQQLFLKLIEKRASYDTSRTFSTWLYTVAANMVKNEYRRKERKDKNSQVKTDFSTEDNNWLKRLDDDFWKKQLQKALYLLEEKHRHCFLLRYQDELPIKEISQIVGCPEGTVKSRLYYATKYLAQELRGLKNTYL